MIQDFEPYAEVLRKIGNQRLPYAVFIDVDSDLDAKLLKQKSGIQLAVDKQILLAEDVQMPHVLSLTTKRYFADINSMLDCILSCKETLCIVFGHYNVLSSKAAMIFNEIHSNVISAASKAWHLAFEDINYKAFTRRIFDNPEIISLQVDAKFAKELQKLEGVVEFKPWHTILYNKTTHGFVQIIWDTRVIVGSAILQNAEYIDTMLKSKNCNDNSFLLYNSIDDTPVRAGFEPYIIDDIIVNY